MSEEEQFLYRAQLHYDYKLRSNTFERIDATTVKVSVYRQAKNTLNLAKLTEKLKQIYYGKGWNMRFDGDFVYLSKVVPVSVSVPVPVPVIPIAPQVEKALPKVAPKAVKVETKIETPKAAPKVAKPVVIPEVPAAEPEIAREVARYTRRSTK